MAKLSAPTLGEPIYSCAENVVVTGCVPGASVDIHADGVQVGGGISSSASGQVFGVAAAGMVGGAKITVTQTLGADVSPPCP